MQQTKIKIYGLFSPSKPWKNSDGAPFYKRAANEDHLDFLHRLIGYGFKAEVISKHTGFPVESVKYVMSRNGFLVK